MNHTLEHVSVIIPTYNRPGDVKETLDSFKSSLSELNEVIIIDQSKNDETKKIVQQYNSKKIRYYHSPIASLTIARNKGALLASDKSTIIVFLDDDITVKKGYFENILEVFNKNHSALGVGGYFLPQGEPNLSNIERMLRKLFLLEHREPNSADVLSAYGAVYPSRLDTIINSQWIPGFNMAFKKEVFKYFRFDENFFSYSLAEDFDYTYRIHSHHPNSLFITPYARLIHRVSTVERYPARKISYMNQINHFYINFKDFNKSFSEKISFMWCILGIAFLRTSLFFLTGKKTNFLKMKFFFESVYHCLKNIQSIRKGILSNPIS